MLKRILTFIMAIALMLAISVPAFASSTDEYNEYCALREKGTLAQDITFDYWKSLKDKSSALEKALENSEDFSVVYDSQNPNSVRAAYSMEKGDVFITSGTSSAGITGHAAIAISSTSILHIAGPGNNPATISLSKWNSTYTTEGWTKIYRHSDSDIADQAGQWASDTYKGSSAKYVISMDLSTTDETYCSKLVWQAYYYGPDEHCANGPAWGAVTL